MRRSLSTILFAVVLFLSFAASAGQASANPPTSSGAPTTTTTTGGTVKTFGISWE